MTGSVTFDRAAGYYDRTRGLSTAAMERVVAVLAPELGGAGPVLEIGVGTGMVSLPLAAAGVRMTGVDLSRPMLARLVEKAGGVAFPLAQADATALPFADSAFGAGIMRHVLHLIPAWERAVREALRAIRQGGVLVVNHSMYPEPYRSLFDRFVAEAEVARPWAGLPPGDLGPLDELLGSLGAAPRRLETVTDRVEEPLSLFVDGMRRGLYSYTWGVAENVRRAAADRVAAWAEERHGPLDAPQERELPIELRAYDLP